MSRFGILFFLTFIFQFSSTVLFSQNLFFVPDSISVIRDSDSLPGIFFQKEKVIINEIYILGNKVTKKHIILRELPFSTGDTIRKNNIDKNIQSAKENLLNSSLFNFVTIDTLSTGSKRVNVLIVVTERWYTWPIPIFEVQERNFNTWWQTKNFERANLGFYINRENFRGRKEELSMYAQFGYTEKYGLTYKVPYLTRKQISGAGISFTYARNKEVTYMAQDNVPVYFKHSDAYIRQEFSGKLHYTYRKGIHNTHYIETKFLQARINDTLLYYSVDYFTNNKSEIKFFLLDYSYRSDYRDSRAYPLRGHFLEFEARKLGLGILKEEKIDVINFFLTLRGYEKISNRIYVSSGLKIKFSPTNKQPYYVQRGLGWGDNVRGYEYYVMDGNSYGITKFGFKYEIIKPRIQKVPLPFKKFNTLHYALYAGIFGDAGYVDDRQYSLYNSLSNSFVYGYGAGIDYVTYYVIVIRMEYSFNKMGEHGFFLNFNAGI